MRLRLRLRLRVRFGAWAVEGELGRGGMSVVYAAVHDESGESRALKVIRAPAGAGEALARFSREVGVADEHRRGNERRAADVWRRVETLLNRHLDRAPGDRRARELRAALSVQRAQDGIRDTRPAPSRCSPRWSATRASTNWPDAWARR
ncbi:hypothetical protein AB5J72_46785 [Streptomyces sp. CG1]|uniref:hypothetical protein n=1 Tax=Streptomyces sp. CG1 TaxID=1287523 RepID=UPI0034E1ED97